MSTLIRQLFGLGRGGDLIFGGIRPQGGFLRRKGAEGRRETRHVSLLGGGVDPAGRTTPPTIPFEPGNFPRGGGSRGGRGGGPPEILP